MSTTTPLAGSSKDNNPGRKNNINKSGIAVGAGMAGAVAALAGDSASAAGQDASAGFGDNGEAFQVYAIKREDAMPDIQPVEQPDEITADAMDAVPYAEVVAAAPDKTPDWVVSIDCSLIPHEAADAVGDNMDADVYVTDGDGAADDMFQVYAIKGENHGAADLQDVAGNDLFVIDLGKESIFDDEPGYDGSVVVDVDNDFATVTAAGDDAGDDTAVDAYNDAPDADASDTSDEYVEDDACSDTDTVDDVDSLSPEHFA